MRHSCPGLVHPRPTIPTNASGPPCATGNPSGRFKCSEASLVSLPTNAPMGMHRCGSLSANSGISSFLYREMGLPGCLFSGVGGFKHSSPSQCHRVAALQELAHISPVSLKLIKSWYSQMVFAESHTLGSFCRIQRALQRNHSAEIGPSPPQLTCNAGSPRHCSMIWSVCEADRASIQRRQFRSGSLFLSKATTEQQVVSTQMQQIS